MVRRGRLRRGRRRRGRYLRGLCLAVGVAALLGCGGAVRAADCATSAVETLHIGGAVICVMFEDRELKVQSALLHTWIDRSAHIVAGYYGAFPAKQVQLVLRSMDGDGIGGGRTTNDPLKIQIRLGAGVGAEALRRDWVLVHEMVHLALPEVGRRHNWLAEGLATYVEGVARAQAGNRETRDVWAEARHSMPAGLPRTGEGGMDETPTWGRTYWGGALFCLQADIAIRQQTHNRVGLQAALQAVLQRTGGYANERSIEEVFKIGDEATGTTVLEDMYQRAKATPQMTDLALLWKQLGVPEDPETQAFDAQAPLAAIRAAITENPLSARKN
jgi:hypothetical protein